MKKEEFRIGNIVSITDELRNNLTHEPPTITCFFNVQAINEDEIQIYANDENIYNHAHIDEIEPIIITEKWLMDFNIMPSHKVGMFRRFYAIGNLTFEIAADNMIAVYFKGELISFINYIHQLQNLYYALAGEELTIKTKTNGE